MNFKFILLCQCFSFLSVNSQLLGNILRPIVKEVHKIKENDLINALDKEIKEVANGLEDLLYLENTATPDVPLANRDEQNNKNDQPIVIKQEKESTIGNEDIRTTDTDVNESDQNNQSSEIDISITEETGTSTELLENLNVLRAILNGGCPKGTGRAPDGSCQYIIKLN